MALIESVFKRSADNRTMSFETIGAETRLPVDEVEHLVMKALRLVCVFLFLRHDVNVRIIGNPINEASARSSWRPCLTFDSWDAHSNLPFSLLSLKLIRGSMDQVEQKAHITWVQPRVLSRQQIGDLSNRLDQWVNKLNTVEKRIAPEVLISA
jgi:26S proteasome regulatory subunit N9